MAYKQKSPYKFLRKLSTAVGGVAGKIFGGGGGGGMDPNKAAMLGGITGGPMGMLMGNRMAGGTGVPFVKRNRKGYSPYKKPSSPLKTDAILVKGAKDMYTGYGTVKYGQIAPARAWTDMVNTVEKTVNRSSKAQLAKDRRRAKRTTRSYDKYADWLEKYDRREHERDRHKQKRRAARDKWRTDVLGKPPTMYADYSGTQHGHGVTNMQDHGLYDGWGSDGGYGGFQKKEGKGYSPYKKPNFNNKKK